MKYSAFLVVVFLLVGCSSEPQKPVMDRKELREFLVEANKAQVGYDTARLVSFIRINRWEMEQTRSGLWYQIINKGDGPLIKEGDVVTLDFTVHLLDGRLCYSTYQDGPKIFKVSRGGVESGLEEAMLFFHGGDSVRIIMPQFRAHHLLGDGLKIPPLATIIYHMRIVEVVSKKKN